MAATYELILSEMADRLDLPDPIAEHPIGDSVMLLEVFVNLERLLDVELPSDVTRGWFTVGDAARSGLNHVV